MIVWHPSRLDGWWSFPRLSPIRFVAHCTRSAAPAAQGGRPPWNIPDTTAAYSLAGDGRDAMVILVSWVALSTRTVTRTTPVVCAWNRARAVPCCV